MNFYAMDWAIEQRLSARQKIVLVIMAGKVKTGSWWCDLAIKELALECGMSESSVKRALKELAATGLIEIEHMRHGKISLPNRYFLPAVKQDVLRHGV